MTIQRIRADLKLSKQDTALKKLTVQRSSNRNKRTTCFLYNLKLHLQFMFPTVQLRITT